MNQKTTSPPSVGDDTPLTDFSTCHEGILSHLQSFGELPGLLEPAARARKVAEETLKFFPKVVFDHHADEEKELFPAVLAGSTEGAERDQVRKMVNDLTAAHRDIEALWTRLEPELKKVAKGHPADVDVQAVGDLVRKYSMHAKLEEDQFLPLSKQILGRDSPEMSGLALSLHMRHVFRDYRRGIRGS
jgi:hypothetical protein